VPGCLVGVGVDRLVLASRRQPHAPVLGVSAIERKPRADQSVGLGDDVKGVLVVALTGAARRLNEEHRLQREDVGTDQRCDHIQDPRVQHEALMNGQATMEHVDPYQMLQPRLRCFVISAERRHARHLETAIEQVRDVVEQLLHLTRCDQPGDDQEPLLVEAHVPRDRDRGRLVHVADATA
jgi:hypothetical protein